MQIQQDLRYVEFLERAVPRRVLEIELPVADLRDILRGKVWSASDESRRPSKRQKDLADIGRILESYPELRSEVPPETLARLY